MTTTEQDPQADPRTDPCPECPDGEVVTTGFGFTNPNATAAYCSAACGWTA